MSVGAFEAEPERLTDDGWDQLVLYDHGDWNQQLCSSLALNACTALLELQRTPSSVDQQSYIDISERGQVKFSLLRPGASILPHTGTTNARLRLHLGLQVPVSVSEAGKHQQFWIKAADEAPRGWADGQVLILDDSFEHSLFSSPSATSETNETCEDASEENLAVSSRLILIIDMDHPDLDRIERNGA